MRLVHPYLTALRFAASLAILRIVATVSALIIGTLALSFDRSLLLPTLALVALAVSLSIIAFAQAFSLKCMVCNCSLFLPKSCAKSPEAQSFLGSRLLEMSLDILLGTNFRCMYCGERCGCRRAAEDHGPSLGFLPFLKPAGSNPALILGRNPASTLAPQIPLATEIPHFDLLSPLATPRTQPAPRAPYPAPPAQQFPAPSLLPQAPRTAPSPNAYPSPRAYDTMWQSHASYA